MIDRIARSPLAALAPAAPLVLAALAAGDARAQTPTWETWTPAKVSSLGSATITAQADGSWLASGVNPDKDVWTLEFSLDKNGWTGLRIEALADPSLGSGGPGRNAGGNFVLTEVKAVAAPRNSDKMKPVALDHPSADFEQAGFGAAMAIDGAPFTGWAIAPQTARDHEWVAQFAKPLGFDGGVKLVLSLEYQFGASHVAGRIRVSGTTSPTPLKATQSGDSFGEVLGKIPAALESGVLWLLDHQLLDGSWAYKQPDFHHGYTALALYTLLKCGVRREHPAIQRAVAFMDSQLPDHTYEASLELMARGALEQDDKQQPRMEEVVARMLAWQVGGWSYPGAGADLSNTQYAAMGLRAAAMHGIRIPPEVWTKLAEEVLRHQQQATGAYEPAGFGYYQKGNAYGSMTAAGVAVLKICCDQYEKYGKPPVAWSIGYKRGVTWIGKHFTASANPLAGPEWIPYWLYSVERVGGLCSLSEFDGHDWYREGARYLIPLQKPEGDWDGHDGPWSHTCFNLLFLARATSSVSGTVSRAQKIWGGDDPRAPASLRASGDTPLTIWVSSFGDAEKQLEAWPQDRGAGLRVVSVDYVLAGRPVLPPAREDAGRWHFTTESPETGWELPAFDPEVAKWKSAPGAFGLLGSAGASVRTEWKSDEIWMRRAFELDEAPLVDPQLLIHRDSALPIRPGAIDGSPLVCLFDEETGFPACMLGHEGGSKVTVQEKDAANGARCLVVTPLQVHEAAIPTWNYAITEKPVPGEFRYLRFAWRKEGPGGIMIQLAVNFGWNAKTKRFVAGPNDVGWPALSLDKDPPKTWKVCTVDLWKEFGSNVVLTGISFTAMKQGVAYFDEVWLARSEADFKNIPKSGVPPPPEPGAPSAGDVVAPVPTGPGAGIEVWLNGTRVFSGDGDYPDYAAVQPLQPLKDLLKTGRNVVAVRCRRNGAGQSVDVAIADQKVLAHVDGRPEIASPGERWPAQFSFEKNGVYVVRARIRVRPPPDEKGGDPPDEPIESAPLTVTIREAPDPELLSYAQDPGRNLVAQVGAAVTASSFRDSGWSPALAADNFQSRGWLSADGDPRPALALTLNKPVRADTVLVSPLGEWVRQSDPNLAARVRRVEVAIDQGKGGTFEIVMPDNGRKGVLRLPRPMVIRRLDLRILDAEGGATRKNGAGLAEVELQIRK